MKKQSRSREFPAKQSARLGAYFAAGVGASMAATPAAEAAIVVIDIGTSGFNIGGINAGLGPNSQVDISYFPLMGAGDLRLLNEDTFIGLDGVGGLVLAFHPGGYASPRKFSSNATIGSGLDFTDSSQYSVFRFVYDDVDDGPITYNSPDFGPGSYMGFRTDQGNYGWLEVTWTAASNEFQILSGAYEGQPGVAILAGDTGAAPIPEPGTWAAAALLAGGAAFARWRKRRDEAQRAAA